MAPSMAASRSSTPGARKGKVEDLPPFKVFEDPTVKENAQANGTVTSGLVEKKVVQTLETQTKVVAAPTATWSQHLWRTAAMVVVAGALLVTGVEATQLAYSLDANFAIYRLLYQSQPPPYHTDWPTSSIVQLWPRLANCRGVLSEWGAMIFQFGGTAFSSSFQLVEPCISSSWLLRLAIGGALVALQCVALLGVWISLRLAKKMYREVSLRL